MPPKKKAQTISSAPVSLCTKYAEKCLLPSTLVLRHGNDTLFKLTTGETVRLEYLGGYDFALCAGKLDSICQELYKMPFSVVERQWQARLGELNGVWHKVRMVKV